MRLSDSQQFLLAELHNAHAAVIAAEALRDQRCGECWRAGIPATRIAHATGTTPTTIIRRYSMASVNGYQGGWHA